MQNRNLISPFFEECDRTNTFWCIFLCLFCDLSFRVCWSFPLNQQWPERHALIRFLQHTKTSSRRLLKHAKNPPIQFSSENNSNWNFNAISKGAMHNRNSPGILNFQRGLHALLVRLKGLHLTVWTFLSLCVWSSDELLMLSWHATAWYFLLASFHCKKWQKTNW